MLALAQSPLNKHYRQLMEAAFYIDDEGYNDLTSFGEYLYSLTGAPLLAELCPYVDANSLSEDEINTLLWLIAGIPLPPPPPPAQLTLL